MKSKSFLFRILLALALGLCVALALSACGDRDTTDTDTDENAPITDDESSVLLLDEIGGEDLSYVLSNDGKGYSVIGYWSELAAKKVVIPEEINGLPVVEIAESAFVSDIYLEEVYIPDSVISIGEHAFDGCVNLKSIRLSSNISSIGAWALDSCDSLETNRFDNALYLGNETNPYLILLGAIDTEITQCTVHNDTRIICDYAFVDCTELETIDLPNTDNLFIGDFVFEYCYDLEFNEYENALYLGNSENPYLLLVEAKNKRIDSCTIHEDTVSISTWAFEGCASIISLVIPENVRFIGAYAFSDCTSLSDVSIAGDSAWKVCPSGAVLNAVEIETADSAENADRLVDIYFYCNFYRE